MNRKSFNKYCAWLMGYKLYTPTPYREGVTVFSSYEKDGKTVCLFDSYNPFDEANQLCEAFDEAIRKRGGMSHMLTMSDKHNDANPIDVKKWMRKIIWSTK